jgi:hypothetical protein
VREANRTEYQARRLTRQKSLQPDKFLIKLAIGFVIAVFLAQCLLLPNRTRSFLSVVDKMEGDQLKIITNTKK